MTTMKRNIVIFLPWNNWVDNRNCNKVSYKQLQAELMAYAAMKPTKAGMEELQEQIHKIRITLSSKNVKNLEKGTSNFTTCYVLF